MPILNFGFWSTVEVSNSVNAVKPTANDSSYGSMNKPTNSGVHRQNANITMHTLTPSAQRQLRQTDGVHILNVADTLVTTTKDTPLKVDGKQAPTIENSLAIQMLTGEIASSSNNRNDTGECRTACAISVPTTIKAQSKKTASSPASTSSFPHERHKQANTVNIGFENVRYATKTGFFKREHKQILRGLTGEFRAGELSAIVGPSGAGKSTLLNILSSYTPHGYSGDIRINGKSRDIKTFKPNIAFITQDTSLQPFLTVKEAMFFAVHLKVGPQMSKNDKSERVSQILEDMGLRECRNTRTGDLSGGQRKRLAISLELVNNPPVLLLDEPTSGLDSSTSNQCISLLKTLALEGRTIIFTMHQPSGIAFAMFDHLFAVAEGSCIYAGRTKSLVPFLAEMGLRCPQSYNPCDFLMEIGTNEYGPYNQRLIEKMQNGRNTDYRQNDDEFSFSTKPQTSTTNSFATKAPLTHNNVIPPVVWKCRGTVDGDKRNTGEHQQRQTKSVSDLTKPRKPKMQIDTGHLCKHENVYATPFYRQLGILLVRTFLIFWRDSSLTTLRFAIHFGVALLIGFLYYDIGNDAANAMNIFRYAFYTIMFIMFCAFSSILTKFPLEFPIVSREHFNRWYSLRAYYVAITLADIPIQVICTSLFTFTTYYLTGQPVELMRLALFFTIIFLTALVGQSIGLSVGSALSVRLGAVFGPFFISPFLAFSGFFLQQKDSPFYLRWMFDISFLKYALDGSMMALFGYGRDKLKCREMYCHHSRPAFFLRDLDMTNANYELGILFLLSSFIGLRILAFYIMSFRLRLFR